MPGHQTEVDGERFCFCSRPRLWGSHRLDSQTEADRELTNQHFGPLFDALMPMERRGGLYVSYRAHKDFVTSIPEYWFMIVATHGMDALASGLRSFGKAGFHATEIES